MKTFIVTAIAAMIPSLAYAQSQELPVCDVAEDPYQCECPLELNESVGSCQVVELEALPDYLQPVDTSAWMSTTWDESRQSWRVSMDLSKSETGPVFKALSNGGDFGSEEARNAWIAGFYNLPMDGADLPPHYIVQRGFGRSIDPTTQTIRTDLSPIIHEMLTPPYDNCFAVRHTSASAYNNTDVATTKYGGMTGELTHCHSVAAKVSRAELLGVYQVYGGLGEDLREVYMASEPTPPVYTMESNEGVPTILGPELFPNFCEYSKCVVTPLLQTIELEGAKLGKVRFVVAEFERVSHRMATVEFQEDYNQQTQAYALTPHWHAELMQERSRLEIAELVTQDKQKVEWNPPNGEQIFGTGDWNSRVHAFDFGCASVELENGDFVNTAVGEYTTQAAGPDKDTYDADIYVVGSLRSERTGLHQLFEPFDDEDDRCWRWQRVRE